MNFKHITRGLFCIAVLSGVGFWIIHHQLEKYQSPVQIKVQRGHGTAAIGGDFDLLDQFGRPHSTREFRGKYMLVYFGYSYCPDICPLGLQNITEGINLLKRDREEVVPIFVTVDPERDTVDQLKQYATHFHPFNADDDRITPSG